MEIINEYEVFLKIVGIESTVVVKVHATSKDKAFDLALIEVCSIQYNDCNLDAVNITRRNI